MTKPRLCRAALHQLPKTIGGLSYKPAELKAGIVHIGPGAFHRAHMARYVHALMSQGQARDWGIVCAGLTPADLPVKAALAPQDGLYTLIERDDNIPDFAELIAERDQAVAIMEACHVQCAA